MLGLKSLRRIEPRMLKDGVNVDTVRWNLTQHKDNAEILKRADGALLANIKQSKQLCRIFLVEDNGSPGGFAWRENGIAGYEATVQEFLRRLSVLIISVAASPCGKVSSSLLHIATRNGDARSSSASIV
jgi:hypothetical protein